MKKFSLSGVNIKNFNFTGEQLLNLKNEEIVRYVPIDNSGFFMTHVELLRRTGSAGKHYEINYLINNSYTAIINFKWLIL